MATREQIRIMLAEVEADVTKTEESLRELRAVAKYLRTRINGHIHNTPVLPGMKIHHPTAKPFRRMKLPAAMQIVLRECGGEMHMKEIAKALVEGGYKDRKTLPVSVASTAARRDDLFVKVAPATYTLANGADKEG